MLHIQNSAIGEGRRGVVAPRSRALVHAVLVRILVRSRVIGSAPFRGRLEKGALFVVPDTQLTRRRCLQVAGGLLVPTKITRSLVPRLVCSCSFRTVRALLGSRGRGTGLARAGTRLLVVEGRHWGRGHGVGGRRRKSRARVGLGGGREGGHNEESSRSSSSNSAAAICLNAAHTTGDVAAEVKSQCNAKLQQHSLATPLPIAGRPRGHDRRARADTRPLFLRPTG